MSVPAPREGLLGRLSRLALLAILSVCLAAVGLMFVTVVLASVNWEPLVNQVISLVVLLGVLYWLMTLLPAPVRRVGKAAGRGVVRIVRKRNERQRR